MLAQIINTYKSQSPSDLEDFLSEIEKLLSRMEDEKEVINRCTSDWPFKKVALLRELRSRYKNLDRIELLILKAARSEKLVQMLFYPLLFSSLSLFVLLFCLLCVLELGV